MERETRGSAGKDADAVAQQRCARLRGRSMTAIRGRDTCALIAGGCTNARPASKRSLSLDRYALAAVAALLEDRPQAAHRLGGVALVPRAPSERVEQLVRQLRGHGLERVLHPGCVPRAGR